MSESIYHLNDTPLRRTRNLQAQRKTNRFRPDLSSIYVREILYQVAIIVMLLIFFSFDPDESEHLTLKTFFTISKLAFFSNYLAAAMVINYVLLPTFYYKKRLVLFALSFAAVIGAVILIDEFILEQIFFADTRGTYFPGLFFTIVETLPIIIIIVAFKLAWDSKRKQTEVERLQHLMQESEIQFLKSQINPHFLFNNLNNLYSYAIDNSPKTPTIILELATVLRYMLYECREDEVALERELQHLRNYASLHQLQMENRGNVIISEDIRNARFYISPLILIVFVENAFKHSTNSLTTDINISIHIQVSETGALRFVCTNNYAAYSQSHGTANGIGLTNVRKRLELLYPGAYNLVTQDEGNTFSTILTMQLKQDQTC